MGGHIDTYLDCSSFYSYLALTYLLKNRDLLLSHDVTVEFHPVFLGGINHGSGNVPPWTLPAKAKYGKFDSDRAKKYHNLTEISVPSFFPPNTLLPQRALCYLKSHYPAQIYEQTYLSLFHSLWITHVNITLPEQLLLALKKTNNFTSEEIEKIVEAGREKEWKDKLVGNTERVLGMGAFGAPWYWVRNEKGEEEPFFGSDRFHFMWEFLGIPWKDIEIIPGEKGKAKL